MSVLLRIGAIFGALIVLLLLSVAAAVIVPMIDLSYFPGAGVLWLLVLVATLLGTLMRVVEGLD